MAFKVDRSGERLVLSVTGALNRELADRLKSEVQSAIDSFRGVLVLDLRDVVHIDSCGIGLLISVYGESRSKKFDFWVVRPRQKSSRTLLDYTRLDQIIHFADELDEVQPSSPS